VRWLVTGLLASTLASCGDDGGSRVQADRCALVPSEIRHGQDTSFQLSGPVESNEAGVLKAGDVECVWSIPSDPNVPHVCPDGHTVYGAPGQLRAVVREDGSYVVVSEIAVIPEACGEAIGDSPPSTS
jgi:hypothetical protein